MNQTGPGIMGPLVPIDPPVEIRLISEFSDFFIHDDYVEFVGQFSMANQSTEPQKLTVGIPTIEIDQTGLVPTEIIFKSSDTPMSYEKKTGADFKPQYDFGDYVTTAQKFFTKRVWYTVPVEFMPRETKNITVKMTVGMLFKSELLRGRKEETGRLFRYDRSMLALWEGSVPRSLVYVTPKVKHEKALKVVPQAQGSVDEKWSYLIEGRRASSVDDLVVKYDPIDLRVTEFGFRNAAKPKTLEPIGERDFKFEYMLDGDLSTAWCEGEKLGAENFAFEIEWGKYKKLKAINIYPGLGPDKDSFEDYNRLKRIFLFLAKPGWMSHPVAILFDDRAQYQKTEIVSREKATIAILQIKDVYVGERKDATCISEIEFELE